MRKRSVLARRYCLAAAGVVLLTGLAAGCGRQGGTGAASGGSETPSTAPSKGDPTSASPSPTAAGPDRCHTAALKIVTKAMGAAAGTHYAAVVLTNTGGTACRAYGYPGMQLLTGSGDKIKTTVVRDGSVKPTLVSVPAGASVYATASWAAIPAGDESQSGNCEPVPASTEVTPPDETRYKVATWSFGPVCQHGKVTVTPLRAGTGPKRS